MVCSDWLGLLLCATLSLPLPQPPHVLQAEIDVTGPLRVTWIGQNKEWGEGWFTKGSDTRQTSIYLLSRSVVSDSVRPHRRQPTRLPRPWDSPGKKLEWVAISFSNAWKWKVKVKALSCVRLLVIPWTAAYQAPPSMRFARQEYWSGVPLPSPTKLHNRLLKKGKGFRIQSSKCRNDVNRQNRNSIIINSIL